MGIWIMIDPITTYLTSVGIHVASSAIYDGMKKIFSTSNPTREELKQAISASLNIVNADIHAEQIINILAENGSITITGTHIFANKSIDMFSSKNTELSLGNNSTSETDKTKIEIKGNGRMVARGGAGWRQNDDGSISFYV